MTREMHPADAARFAAIDRSLAERQLEPSSPLDWQVRARERELLEEALTALDGMVEVAMISAPDDEPGSDTALGEALAVLERARGAGYGNAAAIENAHRGLMHEDE